MRRDFFALISLLFGGIGAQFFYQNRITPGIICILLCWTGIPSLVGLVQGISVLCMSDDEFYANYKRE